jgi:transcriptional regulator with XRE-family HTH domain
VNGEAVRALRERSGLTITQLGERAKIDRANLSRLEAGKRQATPSQIKAIADALLVPVVVIATNDDAAA